MRRFVVAAALALSAAAPAAAGKDTIELVGDYLDRCCAFGWSGAALVVVDGKVALRKGYGSADPETGRLNAPDTLFEIASTTKTFTACAILRLEEMGRLSLDDSIAKHLPGVPKDKAAITIRHLLSHTSGMPRSAAGGYGPDLATAVSAYLRPPLAKSPGEAFAYWNGGYALLAGIVESASGTSYPAFCRKAILEPAGMTSSGFTGDDLPAERQAIGFAGGGRVRPAAGHPYGGSYGWQYRGMGGLVTSAEDLWRFVQAYEAGKILKRATIERMETAVTAHYALGWGHGGTRRGTLKLEHGGDVRGFHTQLVRFPEENAVVILLSNVEEVPMWTLAANVEALVFSEPNRAPMPPLVASLDPKRLVELEGAWTCDDGRVVVRRRGDGVTLAAEGLGTAARLGGPDGRPFAGDVALARAFLDAIVAKDVAAVRRTLRPGIPPTWAKTLIQQIWPEHMKTWGRLRGVRTIGAREIGPRMVEVLLGLDHAKGDRCARIVVVEGKLSRFTREAPSHFVALTFAPTSDSEMTTFSWDGRAPAWTLRLERKRRRVVRLVVSRDGGKPIVLERER